nr:hypothetical protein [uncultured Dysosmobacter sp.]
MREEIENKAVSELEEEMDVSSLQETYKRMIMTEVSRRFVDKFVTELCERNNFSNRILNELQDDIDKRIGNKRYLTNPEIVFVERNGTTYGPIKLTELMTNLFWRGSDPDIKIFDKGKDIISLTKFDAGVRHGKIKVEIYEEDKK